MSFNQYVHQTASSAQETYYQALADGDVNTLLSVWVDDEAILCILPSGDRLMGPEAIRDMHAEIFAQGPIRISYQELQSFETGTVSVHHVLEQFDIIHPHEGTTQYLAQATNVFLRTPAGWQLMLHHASHIPGELDTSSDDDIPPKHLH
ncbi:MAG: DUF3225 domain-containing protein [Lautropia sp.]|nr:DUF3225 domain-containing protein [Lautropia sp.]